MARTEIWIEEVEAITAQGDHVRAVLVSGGKRIALRGSWATLTKAIGLATNAIRQRRKGEVLPLPRH